MDKETQYKTIHSFITDNPCATIATHGDGGRVNLANVFAYIDDNFFLYVVSRPHHRKHDNIETHPQTTLLFTDKAGVTQVEYTGVGKTVDEAKAIADLLPHLQELLTNREDRYWVPPVAQLESDGYVVIKIVPEEIVYRTYSNETRYVRPEEIVINEWS